MDIALVRRYWLCGDGCCSDSDYAVKVNGITVYESHWESNAIDYINTTYPGATWREDTQEDVDDDGESW